MERIEVDILILGAGVTGLSLGSFLDVRDYLILEREDSVGGYCKTKIQDGFVWDYSGHFFHFQDPEIKNYLLENIDCEIFTVQKKSHIYYSGNLIDFPFQNNIHQLSLDEFIECLRDVYLAEKGDSSPRSFKEHIYSKLGKSICDKFVVPYNEKLYAIDLNLLDIESMGRFFPEVQSFEDLLTNISSREKKISYNDTFIYPEFGCFEFIKSILKRVDESKILLNHNVINVDLEKKEVRTAEKTFSFNKLVNTLPLNSLLKMSGDSSETLTSNKVAVFNLGFDLPTEITSNWIYFPGEEVFYRVGFYNNIFDSSRMSLYVEIGLSTDHSIREEELLEKVMLDLNKSGIIKDQKLISKQFIVMSPAYSHITEKSKSVYSDWCDKWNGSGIYSIGRYGEWTYCSIEDNIKQAKKLINKI
jgi:protoporphyrinogen oxidase